MSNFEVTPYHCDLNATSPASSASVSWRLSLFVFFAVLVLALPQAALLPLLDRDEPRFAEASREMWQSGNFVVPTFNHAPRYAKPPLIYWCQTVSYTLFGENAFAARLPSLLATAATAVLLMTWGTRLGSAQMGLGAALSYAFCLQTVQQGRVATADALLIFFMTLTAFAGWLIIHPKEPGRARGVCFVVLALGFAGGFLAKGPEALLPFFPLLWCVRGAGRGVLTGLIVSFVVGLGLVLFWAIPAYIETHGDYWRVGMSEGVGERMITGLQGHGASTFGWYLLSLPLYLLLFWLSALPWSSLLVIHRKKLFSAGKPDLADTYLLLNAGLIFLVFSLMVTKLPHYTLPAFPFLALVFARRWKSVGLSPGCLSKLGWVTGITLALLTAVLIPIVIANHATPSPVGELVRDAGSALTSETGCSVIGFEEPNTVWEIRGVTKGYVKFISQYEFFESLGRPGPQAVVLPTSVWKQIEWRVQHVPLQDHFELPVIPLSTPLEQPFDVRSDTQIPASWKIFEARGWNAAKGSFIDLTLVVKP